LDGLFGFGNPANQKMVGNSLPSLLHLEVQPLQKTCQGPAKRIPRRPERLARSMPGLRLYQNNFLQVESEVKREEFQPCGKIKCWICSECVPADGFVEHLAGHEPPKK